MEQLLDGQIRIERGGAAAPEQRSNREYPLRMTAMNHDGEEKTHLIRSAAEVGGCSSTAGGALCLTQRAVREHLLIRRPGDAGLEHPIRLKAAPTAGTGSVPARNTP